MSDSESIYDVLLEGSPFCDLTFTFTTLDRLPDLGQEVYADDFGINPGGIFNIASALSRFDLCVGLMTELGNDLFSRFIAERMREAGLPLDLVTWLEEPTMLVSAGISFPHDRLFISYASPRCASQLPRRITGEDLDRYRPRVVFTYGDPDLCREAHRRGILVVVDAYWNPEHLRSIALREVLPYADVFAPNLVEALEVTGTSSASEALDILMGWCPCVAIKCGAEGCLGQRGEERVRVPAIPVDAVDTTGAGDNFNAGLIYALLRGYSFPDCLRCANVAGGLSTLVLGGSASTATALDLENWLRRYP